MRQNPPWTQKAARTFFRLAESRIDVTQGLPRPKVAVEVPYVPVPGRYHATGKKKPPKFEEYGTGHYGTVMPTEKEGVVMKVTSDDTEANFVKAALAIEKERKGNWPDGMTRYIDIYRMGGTSHRGRGAYVLWREELLPHSQSFGQFSTTFTDYDKRANREGEFEMKVYMALARNFFKYARGRKGSDILTAVQTFPDRLQNAAHYAYDQARELQSSWPKVSKLIPMYEIRKGANHVCAILLMALEWQFDMMENTYATDMVGHALNFYLRHGIVLCDIHMGNIGHRSVNGMPLVPFVILDPGHSIFLTDKYDRIGVQEI
jgi:hypothetical protein